VEEREKGREEGEVGVPPRVGVERRVGGEGGEKKMVVGCDRVFDGTPPRP
jgi:hypothetical protein